MLESLFQTYDSVIVLDTETTGVNCKSDEIIELGFLRLDRAGERTEEDYLIRHRNWRKGHFELDIVAAKDNELVVVEVKTRSNTEFAQPEDAVDVPKIRRTVRAADTYIKLFQIDIPVRFDIITVVGENGNFEIEHILSLIHI